MSNREPTKGASHSPNRTFRPSRGAITFGFGLVALLALSGFAAACGGGNGSGGSHGQGNGLTTSCSANGPVDALQIPLAAPTTSAPAGSSLDAAYEVEIPSYGSSDSGALIHVPSFYVKIPTNSTSKFPLYFPPINITITASGWSSPLTSNGTLAAPASFTGLHGTKATGSTVSIALMEKDSVGNLSIGFRWGWTLNDSGTVTSAWSVPSATATAPNLPSILTPAPYVGLGETTNTTAAVAGSEFEAIVTGAVGSTSFGVSTEYPNGTEIACKEQKNPWSTTCFVVGVPLIYTNSTPLAPGHYIVHIHDSIGAIVHTISITVVASSGHGGWGSWGWGHGSQQLTCSCQGGHGGSGQGGGNGWGNQGHGSNGSGDSRCGKANGWNVREDRGAR